jgi:hypothetical protein
MSSDDEIQIPWGLPGPTDPVERASAHTINLDRDPLALERVKWSTEDIPEDRGSPNGQES